MPSNNITPLDKAVNLRQLKMSHDVSLQFEETADPASEAVINEYQRLTAGLYQALEDAQQVVAPAQSATSEAQAAAAKADKAAASATTAAGAASSAATAASSAADSASTAATAASSAAAAAEAAKGSYPTIAARLDATEVGLIENDDPMSLLN